MTTIELDDRQRELDRTIDTFETGKKQLFRPDGTKRYSDQEHAEREAELLKSVKDAAQRAREAAKEAIAQADREDTLADFDPLLALAGNQADLVMVKERIISSYIESAPLPDLARRVISISHHGDEIDRRLYALHVHRRLEQVQRQAYKGRATLDGVARPTQVPEGFGEASSALRKLQETLVDTETQKKLAAAKARRKRAEDLNIHVMKRMNDVTGRTEQARQEFAQRMRNLI